MTKKVVLPFGVLKKWRGIVGVAASMVLMLGHAGSAHAKKIKSHIKSRDHLEYSVVFFELFQKDYFSALVENAYAIEHNNPLAREERGEVLKGGMMLSYGMADESKAIFDRLLNANAKEEIRNRAWYYLAKYYYNKSDVANAANALNRISGEIPDDLHFDYHYLATLVRSSGNHNVPGVKEPNIAKLLQTYPNYPYLQFNTAIGQLRKGEIIDAVDNLEKISGYAGEDEEFLVLADRSKLGLAQIAIRMGRFDQAWEYLQAVRTTGLYSNRAMLAYAWAAIKVRRFENAIAALEVLNERSIAIPEVQEAKVLLAHLYEQEGSPRKALKANLLAIKDFADGVNKVAEARRIIDKKDVPREFITNIEAIMDDSDWLSAEPSVDYKNLTPFLIDLMASHPFHETLKELADLYSIRKNLQYWLIQAEEHIIVLDNASRMAFDRQAKGLIKDSQELNARFADAKSELSLISMTLSEEDQERMDVLLGSVNSDLVALDEDVGFFRELKEPYMQPPEYRDMVADLHKRIRMLLQRTELNVVKLEPVMRSLVKAELDKHEERMSYYSAQSRLAKARLYDTTLSTLEDAQRAINEDKKEANK